jgi:alkylhydroperoxidase family enzyme
LARRLGATAEQLSAVERGTFDEVEPSWQTALGLADAMTRAAGQVSDAQFDALSAHWSAEQIVEIVAVVCLFNYFNRFANALNIPVTR